MCVSELVVRVNFKYNYCLFLSTDTSKPEAAALTTQGDPKSDDQEPGMLVCVCEARPYAFREAQSTPIFCQYL